MHRVELGVKNVRGHDRIAQTSGDERLKWEQLALVPGRGDIDKSEMRVAGRAAVTGKMFRAREHAVGAMRANELGGVARDGSGISGKTATLALDDRVVGVGVEVGVMLYGHGAQSKNA